MRAVTVGLIAALSIACNGAPSAPVVGVTPEGAATADALLGVIVEESVDVEDDPFTYAWAWSVDGVLQDDLTGPEVPADRTARGQVWQLAVTADDGEFTGAPGVATLTVANTPPTATVTLGDAALTSDELTPVLDSVDNDGDTVGYTFAWTVDRVDARWTERTVPADRTAAGQVWAVTVTPADDADDGPAVSAEVRIGNSAPTLTHALISPVEPVEASVLAVETDAIDADDDRLEPHVVWLVDDVEVLGALDGTLDGSAFDKGQRVHAEVWMTDPDAAESARVLTEPVVVRNTPPSVRVVRIEPKTLFSDSVASVVGGSWVDDDGDDEAYRVAWTVNGEPAGEGPTLDGAAFARDDRVSCRVWPTDGEDEGEPVDCDTLVVQNSGPDLASVAITPDPGRTGDDLTASPGTVVDPDGDEVSVGYTWTVNGSAAGSGATLSASRTKKGDVVAVTATPSDGAKTGTPVVGTLTIANTAPTISTATLSPSPLRTRDEAAVSWAASDVDGDSVSATITWAVDGTSAGTGDTLGWTWFERDEEVEASIVVSDGIDSSAPTVVSVTVANSAPTSPSVAVSPAYPQEDDDLRCTIATPSKDDDGDTLTYTITWTKNLKPFTATSTTTHTNDTVSADDTSAADLFACTARANDGIETGGVSWASTARIAGGTVAGFTGEVGPTFAGWTQCEGYYDTRTAMEIPADWGADCIDAGFTKLRLACGASTSSYRYIDVSKNVFKDGLSAYPESGIITDARDQSGTTFSVTNAVWAKSNDPHKGASWWGGSQGCGETNNNLTVENRCTYEASNCFGQGLTSANRYLWVYAGY